ncbi:MAG: hypothetical protein Pg6C_10170 [Treponemataceae bacterium]|nr:MAG: hypothetical protein Pg6C_10170 [Treponemataceae bacterium]
MALNESDFAAALKGIYAEMRGAASGNPKDDDWLADKLAKAITDHIKTAEVNAGITVAGGTASGGALVGAATAAIGSLS